MTSSSARIRTALAANVRAPTVWLTASSALVGFVLAADPAVNRLLVTWAGAGLGLLATVIIPVPEPKVQSVDGTPPEVRPA